MKKLNKIKVFVEIKNQSDEKTESYELASAFNINEISRNIKNRAYKPVSITLLAETHINDSEIAHEHGAQDSPDKHVLFKWHFNEEPAEGQSASFVRLARQVLAAKDFLNSEIRKERRPMFVYVRLRLLEGKAIFGKREMSFILNNLKMIEQRSVSNMRISFVLPISVENGMLKMGWIVSSPPEPAKLERMLVETFNNLCNLQGAYGVIDYIQLDKYLLHMDEDMSGHFLVARSFLGRLHAEKNVKLCCG